MNKREQFVAAFEGEKLDPSEALRLEKQLKKTPDKLEARMKLLGFYWQFEATNSGRYSLKRYRQVLWMIEHHPDYASVIAKYIALDQYPIGLWTEARSRWNVQIENAGEDPLVMFNAALFLIKRDFERARSLLKDLQTTDDSRRRQYTGVLCSRTHEAMLLAQMDTKVKFAEIVMEEGKEAINLGFTHPSDRWETFSHLSDAAFVLGEFELAAAYANKAPRSDSNADRDPQEFKSNMLGLVALKTKDLKAAKQHFQKCLSFDRFPYQLASELMQAGESESVTRAIEIYFNTSIKPSETPLWLEYIGTGLVP